MYLHYTVSVCEYIDWHGHDCAVMIARLYHCYGGGGGCVCVCVCVCVFVCVCITYIAVQIRAHRHMGRICTEVK